MNKKVQRRALQSMNVLSREKDSVEQVLYVALLSNGPMSVDELQKITGKNADEIAVCLETFNKKDILKTKYSLITNSRETRREKSIDWEYKPELSSACRVDTISEGILITSPWDERLLLNENEWEAVRRFDRTRSIIEICRELIKIDVYLFPHNVSNLITKLEDIGALANYKRTSYFTRSSFIEKIFKSLEITLLTVRPKKTPFLLQMGKLCKFIFSWPMYILALIIFFAATINIWDAEGAFTIDKIIPAWGYFITWYLIGIISLFIHEAGHFFSLIALGGFPRACMLRLYNYVSPIVTVDSSDAWSLKRSSRIKVMLAGLQLNAFLCLAGFIVWRACLDYAAISTLGKQVFIGNYAMILVNLCPLIRTDGYFVIGQLLGVNHLRKKAFAVVFPALQKSVRLPDNGFFKPFAWVYVVGSLFFLGSSLFGLVKTLFKNVFN